MLSKHNLWNFGTPVTAIIYQFADLDLKFLRFGVGLRRKLNMRKSVLTNTVNSDDEYFDGEQKAVQKYPLTYLSDVFVGCPVLEREILQGLRRPDVPLSVLDVIVLYLIKPHAKLLSIPISDCVFQACPLIFLSGKDYVFESGWSKYQWCGREYLYNSRTQEFFYADRPCSWKAYSYRRAVWWLHREGRWFFDPI